MSLENKIELLTVAIERLTAMLEKTAPKETTPSLAEPKQKVPKELPTLTHLTPAPEPTATKVVITVDDLKSICTEIVRNNREDKPKITALLDSFNAKTLSDLKPTDYADVKQCLEALKNV